MLIIKLDRELMPRIISTMFGENWIKTTKVREQTLSILQNSNHSRAITPACVERSGWLSNLAEILWPLTLSPSLMMIELKMFELESGHRQFIKISTFQGP